VNSTQAISSRVISRTTFVIALMLHISHIYTQSLPLPVFQDFHAISFHVYLRLARAPHHSMPHTTNTPPRNMLIHIPTPPRIHITASPRPKLNIANPSPRHAPRARSAATGFLVVFDCSGLGTSGTCQHMILHQPKLRHMMPHWRRDIIESRRQWGGGGRGGKVKHTYDYVQPQHTVHHR
jgi:hypothetical protein